MTLLEATDFSTLEHSGGSLQSHLLGTARLLSAWGADHDLIQAGRYYGIYPSQSIPDQLVPYADRPAIAAELGARSEGLIYLHSMLDPGWFTSVMAVLKRPTFTPPLLRESLVVRLRDGPGSEEVSLADVRALAALILAAGIEQAPRLPVRGLRQLYWRDLAAIAKPVLPALTDSDLLFKLNDLAPVADIGSLKAALTWQTPHVLSHTRAGYEALSLDAFSSLLARIDADKPTVLPLSWIFEQLDPASRLRCAISPKVASRALHPSYWNPLESMKLVADWMLRQGFVAGLVAPEAVSAGLSADDRYVCQPEQAQKVAVPVLHATWPVDFAFDYQHVWLRGPRTPDVGLLHPQVKAQALTRVSQALDLIFATAPHFRNWMSESVRLISLREDNSPKKGHGSSSWPRVPGIIGLVNTANPQTPIERLVSGIIHESIHNMLYMIELDHPFSVDTDRVHGLKAVSPWSKNTIPLGAYLHACCVWFGIHMFWKKAIADGSHTDALAYAELERSQAGFRHETYLGQLDPIKAHIRPDILDLLAHFRDVTS